MIELDAQQSEAVQRALTLNGFAFFAQPRVGKTRMTLEVIRQRKDIDYVLVVCPKNVMPVWRQATTNADIVTYEFFNQSKNRAAIRRKLSRSCSIMVLDEAHRIKRRSSKQSRGVRAASKHATYRLALTGTPIAQGLQDAWAIFNFLDPAIFGPWSDFQNQYLIMGGYQGRKVVGYRNEDQFRRIMHTHSARIRLSEVAERSVRVIRSIVRLPMPPATRATYSELETELVTEANRVRVEAPLVITLATRLQQITGGWLCNGDKSVRIDKTKTGWLNMHLRNQIPAVIVCRYLNEIDAIEKLMKLMRLSCVVIRGGKPLSEPFGSDVAIVQIASGIGIDLSHARTVIFYSWDHSYINFEQMRFRILSRSRTTARYIFLMMKNSIDELIYESCTKKRKLSTLICDHYRR